MRLSLFYKVEINFLPFLKKSCLKVSFFIFVPLQREIIHHFLPSVKGKNKNLLIFIHPFVTIQF